MLGFRLDKARKMSDATLAMLEKVRQRIENATPDQLAGHTDIVQYNVRLDGKVAKTFTINMKDHAFVDGATANDLEVTINDEDLMPAFLSTVHLSDLLSQGKIEVKGDLEVVKVLDARNKKHAEAMAAARAAVEQK